MTKTVLLTGAGGFIGCHTLAHVLTETDWDVVAVDSFRHKGKTDRINQTLAGGPAEWRDRLRVEVHDLAAPLSGQAIGRLGRVDYLIAMASQSHVDRSIADPAGFIRNNTEVALTTLEYARVARPDHVIWISTDEVYGPLLPGQEGGHPEWSPVIPSNPYSASKAAQEAIAVAYWRTFGVPLTIVNCMNLIGEMQDREKFLPSLIAGIGARRMVTIHGTPAGPGAAADIGSRHYLHARNLADALVFIFRNLPAVMFSRDGAAMPDRFNIVGPDRVTNLELAEMVALELGQPLRYILEDFHRTRPGHDPHYGLDGAKITGLGWKPPVPFRASLAKTITWSLAHPEWLD